MKSIIQSINAKEDENKAWKVKWTNWNTPLSKKVKKKKFFFQFKKTSFLIWFCTSKIYFKYTGIIMEAHGNSDWKENNDIKEIYYNWML